MILEQRNQKINMKDVWNWAWMFLGEKNPCQRITFQNRERGLLIDLSLEA